MSKTKKILIVCSVVCILAGALIMLASLLSVDFNWKLLSNEKSECHGTVVSDSFDEIKIDVTEADVAILATDDAEVKVECVETDLVRHKVEVMNGKLYITREDGRPWYMRIGIMLSEYSIKVYIPKSISDEIHSLYIKTVSGDIDVNGELEFSRGELFSTSGTINSSASFSEGAMVKSVSGDLNIGNVCGIASIGTTSGDVELENVGGDVKIKTTSGDIKVKNIWADAVSIESTSGKISLSEGEVKADLFLKAVSGDVEVKDISCLAIDVKTTSGDVNMKLPGERSYEIDTESGNVSVPSSHKNAEGCCKVNTTSGDITISE